EDAHVVASGTNYATAIETLIDSRVPGLEYAFASTDYESPRLTFPVQEDPWAAAVDMARKIGMVLYFDGLGRCVLETQPDLASASPVDTWAEGDGGVLVSAAVSMDRSTTYNVVQAVSSNASGAIYEGTAEDDDPSS